MYNPCVECMNRYGRQYTKECDSKCEYANAISKLKPYGRYKIITKMYNLKYHFNISDDAFKAYLRYNFNL